MMVLDMASRLAAPLEVRYACLVHDLGKGSTPEQHWPRHHGHEGRSAKLAEAVGERLKVPQACRELADVVAREHGNVHRSGELGPAAVLRLLERCDALRRPDRFALVLLACECDMRGRLGMEERSYPPRAAPAVGAARSRSKSMPRRWRRRRMARGLAGPAVGEAVRAARVRALADHFG